MKYHQGVDYKEVISEWAKKEKASPNEILRRRAPLLGALPKDTSWFKVSITKEDLGSLKVINSDIGWEIVSDYSGDIDHIVQNLSKFLKNPPPLPNRVLPSGITLEQYVSGLIESLHKFRINAGNKGLNLTLILISSTKKGPFTILEGNHTAVGLYFRYFIDHPKLSYPTHDSYVGISSSMNKCLWYRSS